MNSKIKCSIIGLFGFLLSTLAQAAIQSTNVIIPSSSTDYAASLGTGYATDEEQFKGVCIEGTETSQGLNQATLDFKQSISYSQLEQELGFAVAGRARLGVVDVSAAAKFISQSRSEAFSISAIYSGDYRFKNRILTKMIPSSIGREIRNNDERWIAGCGDEFVEQQLLGAKIFFSIRIDFTSESDKKAFEASFSANAPLWSASGQLKSSTSQFSKNTKVTIAAYQIGGKVEELSQIFGSSENLTSCSFGNFGKCEEVLRSALVYTTQTFPKQITESTGDPSQPGGPAVLKYLTKPYATAGIFLKHPPIVSKAVKLARKDLDMYLTKNVEFRDITQRYLGSTGRRLSPRQVLLFKKIAGELKQNLARIIEAGQGCYDDPSPECVVTVSSLDPATPRGLYQLDPKDLIIENETFAQYCDEGSSPQSSNSLRKTVSALINRARVLRPEAFVSEEEIVANKDSNVDECFVSSNVLTKQISLDLRKLGITDTRVFADFLQTEELYLDENEISDVAPLALLKSLRVLSLRGNKIEDASPLSVAIQLSKLDLRNNYRDLKCPLNLSTGKITCLTSDFGHSGQFISAEKRNGILRFGLTTSLIGPESNLEVFIYGGTFEDSSKQAELFNTGHGDFKEIDGVNNVTLFHTATVLNDGRVLILGGLGKARGLFYDPKLRAFKKISDKMASACSVPANRRQFS